MFPIEDIFLTKILYSTTHPIVITFEFKAGQKT